MANQYLRKKKNNTQKKNTITNRFMEQMKTQKIIKNATIKKVNYSLTSLFHSGKNIF